MGLSETWLTISSPEAAVSLPDYKTFTKDRGRGRGGGVLLYVKGWGFVLLKKKSVGRGTGRGEHAVVR